MDTIDKINLILSFWNYHFIQNAEEIINTNDVDLCSNLFVSLTYYIEAQKRINGHNHYTLIDTKSYIKEELLLKSGYRAIIKNVNQLTKTNAKQVFTLSLRDILIHLVSECSTVINFRIELVLNDCDSDPEWSAVSVSNLIKSTVDIAKEVNYSLPYNNVQEYFSRNNYSLTQYKIFEQKRISESAYYLGEQL